MSQTAIPLQFEQYMQNQISVGLSPDMNEMIFAYIPDLDLEEPIDRTQGLPDVATWVYQQDIDQLGKVGNNALAYSVVIASNVAEFTFNAIYLRDKNVPSSCGMVVYKPDETKENGSSVTKSLLQEYIGAAQVVGVDVDAGTWQIDYQARLKGIEEDHRLACLDTYGQTAFVDGFDVTQQADVTKYLISPGVVYLGGLRGVLANEIIQTIATKPTDIYLDIYRAGTSTSKWENILEVRVSETVLADYVADGVQHYVAKVAGVNADGSVVDARVKPHNEKLMESMVGMVVPFHMAGEKRGWLDAKGGEFSRFVDPVLWKYAQETGLVISQVAKDTDPMTYAMYFGDGDGSTTFTVPNHHLGHFVRGNPAGENHGETKGDAIRNITGQINVIKCGESIRGKSGIFSNSYTSSVSGSGHIGDEYQSDLFIDFDASNSVPTADENRPYTANLAIKIHRGWM